VLTTGSKSDPLVVAHRAGNDLARLRAAQDTGADVIEADVHIWDGRLELRHTKRLGPLPFYWDRRQLPRAGGDVLRLEQLLDAAPADVGLLLDLKGIDPRLPAALERLVRARAAERPLSVCSRNWRLLRPFAAMDGIDVIHSAGSVRQLRRLRDLVATARVDAVSVNHRLLTPATARELCARVSRVWAWTVNSVPDMERLRSWGVAAMISDDPAALRMPAAA
jgi:glycerophosphoryl diester phosphodiesterase